MDRVGGELSDAKFKYFSLSHRHSDTEECTGSLACRAPLSLLGKCPGTPGSAQFSLMSADWNQAACRVSQTAPALQDRPGVGLMFALRATWGCWAL